MADHRCENCGERLHKDRIVWLELNSRTHRYCDPDVTPVPETDSQGGFPFGIACAKRVLANGGELTNGAGGNIVLSARDRDTFLKSIERSPEPNAALKALLRKSKPRRPPSPRSRKG